MKKNIKEIFDDIHFLNEKLKQDLMFKNEKERLEILACYEAKIEALYALLCR